MTPRAKADFYHPTFIIRLYQKIALTEHNHYWLSIADTISYSSAENTTFRLRTEKGIEETPSSITGWFCTCTLGARVSGCCAHIASVLWHLRFERHHQAKTLKTHDKYMDSLIDAAAEVLDTNSDSSEGSDTE